MPRLAYVVELDPISIAQLQAAQALIQDILEGIQVINIPEEEAEITAVVTAPEPESERTPDPMFTPPPAPPPINNQSDFGAGPPPNMG